MTDNGRMKLMHLLLLVGLTVVMTETGASADLFREPYNATPEQKAAFAALVDPVAVLGHGSGYRFVYGRIIGYEDSGQTPFRPYRAICFGVGGAAHSPENIFPPNALMALDVDSDLDLVRLFSDRHLSAEVPFGSDEHRVLLFRTLDPDGALGLSDGLAPPELPVRREGRLISATHEGTITMAESFERRVRFDPLGGVPAIVEIKGPAKMGAADLLAFAARAAHYPNAFEPGFAGRARAAFGMLLGLAPVEASRAPESLRREAIQLEVTGVEALEALTSAFQHRRPLEVSVELARRTGNEFPNWIRGPHDMVFPPDPLDRIRAAARVVVAESSLRRFYPRKAGHSDYAFFELGVEQPAFQPDGIESGDGDRDAEEELLYSSIGAELARSMILCAVPETIELHVAGEEFLTWQYVPDAEVQTLIRQGLTQLAGGGDAPPERAEDAHLYRKLLCRNLNYWQLTEKPNRTRFIMRIMQDVSWGEPREIIPIVDDVFQGTFNDLPYGFKVGDDFDPKILLGFELLRQWYLADAGRTATVMHRRLDDKLAAIEERAQELEDSDSRERRQLALWRRFVTEF